MVCVFDLLLAVVRLLVLLLSIRCYVGFRCLACSGLFVVLFGGMWLVLMLCYCKWVAVLVCLLFGLFAACGSGIAYYIS